MAKFCEGCPDMGSCTGEIVGICVESSWTSGNISEDRRTATFVAINGVPQGPTHMEYRYVDPEDGKSETLVAGGNSVYEARDSVGEYVGKIGKCQQPERVKKLFGLITRKQCGAQKA
jgi:hypothetical protein